MKLDFYLKRRRMSLKNYIESNNITNYQELLDCANKMGLIVTDSKSIGEYEFKKQNVEEGTANQSNSKKKRVSNKKGSKPKTNDSTSSRRSRSTQRVRKSSTKPQRKSNSGKVEPVQPASGSEDTK